MANLGVGKKSQFPLLDELSPPVNEPVAKLRPATNLAKKPAAATGGPIQDVLTKVFGTVPRNKMKEAGLDE